MDPWEIIFYVKILPANLSPEGGKGKRVNPSSGKKGDGQSAPSALELPKILEVRKEDWDKHHFTNSSAIEIKKNGDDTDVFVNMDNIYLITELKKRTSDYVAVINAQFKYGLALYAISYLMVSEVDEGGYANVYKGAEALAMILIPSLNELSSLIVG